MGPIDERWFFKSGVTNLSPISTPVRNHCRNASSITLRVSFTGARNWSLILHVPPGFPHGTAEAPLPTEPLALDRERDSDRAGTLRSLRRASSRGGDPFGKCQGVYNCGTLEQDLTRKSSRSTPILQMGRRRPRERKGDSQGHTAKSEAASRPLDFRSRALPTTPVWALQITPLPLFTQRRGESAFSNSTGECAEG